MTENQISPADPGQLRHQIIMFLILYYLYFCYYWYFSILLLLLLLKIVQVNIFLFLLAFMDESTITRAMLPSLNWVTLGVTSNGNDFCVVEEVLAVFVTELDFNSSEDCGVMGPTCFPPATRAWKGGKSIERGSVARSCGV
jgi:hypothetical protein